MMLKEAMQSILNEENKLMQTLLPPLLTILLIGAIPILIIYLLSRAGGLKTGKLGKSHLEKYEDAYFKYINAKDICKNIYKSQAIVQIPFILSIILIPLGWLDTFRMGADGSDVLFTIGCALFGIAFLISLVKYFLNGGWKELGKATEGIYSKYEKPNRVTEITYQKWDDEPDSAYQEIGRRTYDKSVESNAITFIINCIAFIFKLIYAIEFVLIYMIDSLLVTLSYITVYQFGRNALIKSAERNYRLFIDEAIQDGGAHFSDNLYDNDDYNEIPRIVHKELFDKSVKVIKSEEKQDFLFVHTNFLEDNGTTYTGVKITKHVCSCDYGKGKFHYFENDLGRICVTESKLENGEVGYLTLIFPFNPSEEWIKEWSSTNETRGVLEFAQYAFLKDIYLKGDKNAQQKILYYDEQSKKIVPILVKPCDIKFLDEDLENYYLKINQDPSNSISSDIASPSFSNDENCEEDKVLLFKILKYEPNTSICKVKKNEKKLSLAEKIIMGVSSVLALIPCAIIGCMLAFNIDLQAEGNEFALNIVKIITNPVALILVAIMLAIAIILLIKQEYLLFEKNTPALKRILFLISSGICAVSAFLTLISFASVFVGFTGVAIPDIVALILMCIRDLSFLWEALTIIPFIILSFCSPRRKNIRMNK